MGKHYIENSNMSFRKIFLAITILVVAVAGIIGVIFVKMNHSNTYTEFESEMTVINNAFSALKTSNINEVEKYLSYTELISGFDESIIQEDITELERNLFNTMEWSIENIRKENDNVVAIVNVTNKNYKNIITEWLKQIVDLKSNSEEISNEESLQVLENILKKNKCGTESVIKKIQLVEQDKEWKIVVNEDLINLIYPGIETINSVL